MSDEPTLSDVLDRIRRMLVALELQAEVFGENGYLVPFDEHVAVFVVVDEHRSEDGSYVRYPVDCFARILSKIPVTPELLEFLAFPPSFTWGNLVSWREDDGSASLAYRNVILGDYLDQKELSNAVLTVAGTAEGLIEDLHPRFGGLRLGEE